VYSVAIETKHDKWLKKLGLKEIPIHMGMFDFWLNVVIGKEEGLSEYVAFKFETTEDDKILSGWKRRGAVFSKGNFCPILWLPRYPRGPREQATVAHEALHIVYDIMAWAGIPMTRDTEEVVTHAMGHIISKILESKSK
jgi:hypothetical protein